LDWRRWTDPGDVDQAVLKYNRQLMQAILHDKIQIAKAVNVTVIRLDDAPKGYVDFDKGTAKKFVLDPTRCWQLKQHPLRPGRTARSAVVELGV
jgi:hypothetical protein